MITTANMHATRPVAAMCNVRETGAEGNTTTPPREPAAARRDANTRTTARANLYSESGIPEVELHLYEYRGPQRGQKEA